MQRIAERQRANTLHEERWVTFHHDDDGALVLEARLPPEPSARLLRNYLTTMVLELQTLARACGKSHVHNLEPEDLVALTVEAAAMARVPLAGTDWIPGSG